MKNRFKVVSIILLLTIISCSKEYQSSTPSAVNVSFTFGVDSYIGDTESKNTKANIPNLKNVRQYIFNQNDLQLSKDVKSVYVAKESKIAVENLRDGKYFLVILADNTPTQDENIGIHEITQGDGKLLSVSPGNTAPIKDEYFYVNHPFEVINGKVEQTSIISLKIIVACFDFKFIFESQIVEKTVQSIELIPDETITYANSFYANNTYSETGNSLTPLSLLVNRSVMLMPATDNKNFAGKIKVTWEPDKGETVVRQYSFSAKVVPNKLTNIIINIEHPLNEMGVILVEEIDYNESNFYKILQDDESFFTYDEEEDDDYPNNSLSLDSKRSFRIDKPLQAKLTEDRKLHLRFYSPVAINNVRVYAKIIGIAKKFEIARIDHIPAFADIITPITLTQKNAKYKTLDGEVLYIGRIERLEKEDIEFSIFCDDPYMKKIEQIRARWIISFSTFGRDPNRPDGGYKPNSGYYKGIRPVHIREAVAIYTNFAFMLSLPAFENKVLNHSAGFYDDNGRTVKNEDIIPQFEGFKGFKTGLAQGVYGFTAGFNLTLAQDIFFQHYAAWAAVVVFHEIGHSLGYSHSSSFCYGNFDSVICKDFYTENCETFPVGNINILDSSNNPNKY